jgi:hypothetical protein
MMNRTKQIVLTAVLSIVALLWLADEYPFLRFHGDAVFSGGPVLGYQIKMRPIPFNQAGEYVFHFHGMPNEELSLQLYIEGKSLDNESELTHLETTIEALMADENGQIICDASGSPLAGSGKIDDSNPKGWVTMLGGDAAYWNGNCLRMSLKPSHSYSLTIRIRDIDPATPKVNLIPTLEGGQPDS